MIATLRAIAQDDIASGIVRFSVSQTAEPGDVLPALAAILISQWHERKAQRQLAGGEQDQTEKHGA